MVSHQKVVLHPTAAFRRLPREAALGFGGDTVELRVHGFSPSWRLTLTLSIRFVADIVFLLSPGIDGPHSLPQRRR